MFPLRNDGRIDWKPGRKKHKHMVSLLSYLIIHRPRNYARKYSPLLALVALCKVDQLQCLDGIERDFGFISWLYIDLFNRTTTNHHLVPFNKACSFELARGCSNTYWPINAVWIIRKAKKTSTEGDKVKGVKRAKARIQECATARVRIIRAAFEPGDFKYEASQECISKATVMTLRTISSVVAPLCLHGSMPIATLALWMVLEASSGWFCHHSLTFSNCFSNVSCLC